MGILISVITITLLVLCYVRMYNRLKRLFVKVQEGSAGIDVACLLYTSPSPRD